MDTRIPPLEIKICLSRTLRSPESYQGDWPHVLQSRARLFVERGELRGYGAVPRPGCPTTAPGIRAWRQAKGASGVIIWFLHLYVLFVVNVVCVYGCHLFIVLVLFVL